MEHPNLVEDLGALRLVDALNSEVLDGLLLPPLIHRRVLAAADGLVDMEVVHSREAGGGGGAPLSSPVRLGFEIREAETCGRNGGGRRGGICG